MRATDERALGSGPRSPTSQQCGWRLRAHLLGSLLLAVERRRLFFQCRNLLLIPLPLIAMSYVTLHTSHVRIGIWKEATYPSLSLPEQLEDI